LGSSPRRKLEVPIAVPIEMHQLLALALLALGVHADIDSFLGFTQRERLVGTSDAAGSEIVAWIETTQGVSNVFSAEEAKGWAPQKLTNFSGDNAIDLSELQFLTVEGFDKLLAFTIETHASTNPVNYAILPDASSTRLVTANGSPFADKLVSVFPKQPFAEWAPDGLSFLFIVSGGGCSAGWQPANGYVTPPAHSVCEQSTKKGAASPTTPLFSVQQGSISDLSIQGDVISFSNNRGDHGFIGLVRKGPGKQKVQWIAPSVDSDISPVWSPDGLRLAWVRLRMPVGDDGYRSVQYMKRTSTLFFPAIPLRARCLRAPHPPPYRF
jgi:hypothetical protein